MTVIDSSGVIDYLLGDSAAGEVGRLFDAEVTLVAPDLLVFEVLAVLRRHVMRGDLTAQRAQAAIDDLGEASIDLFPSMSLRGRAWELRENITAADALFVALAELLEEPLASKDRGLLRAASRQAGVAAVELA